MTSHDAWVLSRLLYGNALDDEPASVSARFRRVASELATRPPEGRPAAWNGYLAGQEDSEPLIKALADADPLGTPPEAGADDDESDDGWGPIRQVSLPPAEPFPLDVLPHPARAMAEAAALAIGCPVDYPAVAILAAASGVIGRSASLLVKEDYFASASLYTALVGGPSSGKTPAINKALAPVWEISHRLHAEWCPRIEAWKAAKPEERNEEPTLSRLITTDPTTEALGLILARNPRGLIVAPDEMTKWVMSMDQYRGGKGGDRPFYLSAWSGTPVYIDRAKHMKEPIVIPHPFLSVVGGLTPDMLSELSEGQGRDDGFLARLLFAFPPHQPHKVSIEGVSATVAQDWGALILSLWERPMSSRDGKPVPHVVKMSPEARQEWLGWCSAHFAEQEADDFPDSLSGPWGKLESYLARLALIVHLMRTASDPCRDRDSLPELPPKIITDTARLVSYFKSHARRVHRALSGKANGGGEDVHALCRWIRRSQVKSFSEREVRRHLPRLRDEPAALADALAWMIEKNLIRPLPEPESSPRPGRKRTPVYEVNPRFKGAPRN